MRERTDRAEFGVLFPETLDCVHLHLHRLTGAQLYEDGLRDCRRWRARGEHLRLLALRNPLQMRRQHFRVVVKDRRIRAVARCGIVARTVDLKFEDDRIPVCGLVAGALLRLE